MSYRAVVETDPVRNRMRIFLIDEDRRSTRVLKIVGNSADDTVHSQWVPCEEGALLPEPTLHLESGLVLALYEALKEHFPQPHTPGELGAARLAGELDGVRGHVSHLQRLLGDVIGLLDPRIRTQVGEVSELRQQIIHGAAVEAEPARSSPGFAERLREMGARVGPEGEEGLGNSLNEDGPVMDDPGIGSATRDQEDGPTGPADQDGGIDVYGEAAGMGAQVAERADGEGDGQDQGPVRRVMET